MVTRGTARRLLTWALRSLGDGFPERRPSLATCRKSFLHAQKTQREIKDTFFIFCGNLSLFSHKIVNFLFQINRHVSLWSETFLWLPYSVESRKIRFSVATRTRSFCWAGGCPQKLRSVLASSVENSHVEELCCSTRAECCKEIH